MFNHFGKTHSGEITFVQKSPNSNKLSFFEEMKGFRKYINIWTLKPRNIFLLSTQLRHSQIMLPLKGSLILDPDVTLLMVLFLFLLLIIMVVNYNLLQSVSLKGSAEEPNGIWKRTGSQFLIERSIQETFLFSQ